MDNAPVAGRWPDRWLERAGIGLVCLLAACSSDSDKEESCAGGACAGSGGLGSVGGNAASGGGGASGGVVGKGGGAGTATGGAAGSTTSARCEGTFGASRTVFAAGDTVLASLSITEDELELFYVELLSEEERLISVLSRATKDAAFPSTGTRVPELQAICAAGNYPTLDVSNDGLRMYFICLEDSSPLRLATRASRSATWTVAPEPIGTVADSIGVSDDELTAVAVEDLLEAPRPVLYRRASRSEPFGSAQDIPLIPDAFRNPDLVGNRHLFGITRDPAGLDRVVVSALTDASPLSYSVPTTDGMPAPSGAAVSSTYDYTPTVTPNCRTISFPAAAPLGCRRTVDH